MKHTSLKFFYTHELQKKGVISVKQVQSSNNFIKFLQKFYFFMYIQKIVTGIGM